MIHWVKNSGQFPPGVAYVANWPDALTKQYHGAGVVTLDDALNPTAIEYGNDSGLTAMASAYQLVVTHGSALAAALNVLNPEP